MLLFLLPPAELVEDCLALLAKSAWLALALKVELQGTGGTWRMAPIARAGAAAGFVEKALLVGSRTSAGRLRVITDIIPFMNIEGMTITDDDAVHRPARVLSEPL